MNAHDLLQQHAQSQRAVNSPAISHLTDDSRSARPGSLLVVRGPWSPRCATYVQHAVSAGVLAVLTQPDAPATSIASHLAWYTAPRVDQALAGEIADRFYDHPARKLKLIGITGTNGKTTIALITQHLLQQAGIKTGLLGTIHTDTGDVLGPTPAHLTTPGSIELRELFHAMTLNGCTACAMEVSSHALHQGRTAGLTFDAAVFTNLTQDHLDYHHTMDAYAQAKAILFSQLGDTGYAILNADDEHAAVMATHASSGRVLWTTLSDRVFDASQSVSRGSVFSLGAVSCSARFAGPWGSAEADLPMVGRHNVSNALQAACAAHVVVQSTGRELRERLEACPPVPGRLEPVRIVGKPGPAVLVDYAHTPDALDNALAAVRPLTVGRLVLVFGCGGDRDRSKRPRMMQAALRGADVVVLTSDNPRSEDPQAILNDALADLTPTQLATVQVEPDRATAIAQAIRNAHANDTVLIAGKGHEDYQIVAHPPGIYGQGTKQLHFDDREHARAALGAGGSES